MRDYELSVIKRLGMSMEEAHEQFTQAGFEATGTSLDGRIRYHENAGVGITIIRGPMGGVLVLPSGPIRGKLFGENSVRAGDSRPRIIMDEEDGYENNENSSRSDYDEIIV